MKTTLGVQCFHSTESPLPKSMQVCDTKEDNTMTAQVRRPFDQAWGRSQNRRTGAEQPGIESQLCTHLAV